MQDVLVHNTCLPAWLYDFIIYCYFQIKYVACKKKYLLSKQYTHKLQQYIHKGMHNGLFMRKSKEFVIPVAEKADIFYIFYYQKI